MSLIPKKEWVKQGWIQGGGGEGCIFTLYGCKNYDQFMSTAPWKNPVSAPRDKINISQFENNFKNFYLVYKISDF